MAAEAGSPPPAEGQWVVFRCDARRFGFMLERAREIITPRPFTRLPGAGPEVCGLIGFRGRVITVFDLGVVLGLRGAGTLPDHRLLLLDVGTRRVAAAVDDVVSIARAKLEPRPSADLYDGPASAGVLGLGRGEDGIFTALDPDPLLQHLLAA